MRVRVGCAVVLVLLLHGCGANPVPAPTPAPVLPKIFIADDVAPEVLVCIPETEMYQAAERCTSVGDLRRYLHTLVRAE